jgi:DNA topoisomerase I
MDQNRTALVYVCDTMPGLRRRRCGGGFSYVAADGALLRCAEERARIRSLGIPPAWTDVWICADAQGHIQATGRDAAGRKQYRYHPLWRQRRDEQKYDQLCSFGHALPRLRRKVRRDLDGEPGTLDFSIAAIVRLLDEAHLRIGSRPADANGSFGATTLRRRHVKLEKDGTIRLRFRAKGGKRVRRTLRDRRLHRVLQAIDDLAGAQLFTWIDEAGEPRPITAQHVNSYLAKTIEMEGVTAKTFRTWAGSVAALKFALQTQTALTIKALSEAAARRLHNTPNICRNSYIHPEVLGLVTLSAEELEAWRGDQPPEAPRGLRVAERKLLQLLERADPPPVRESLANGKMSP